MTTLYKYFLIALSCFFQYCQSSAQIITDDSLMSNMEKQLQVQKDLAKNHSAQLFNVLNKSLKKDEEQALKFLLAYAPLSDLADYSGQFFLDNARIALKAREEMDWGEKIPEDIFLHFVLPIRVNNENLDSFRILMYKELKNRVKGLSLKEAALEVNHWCHEKVTYRGADARTSSPLATMCYSYGRCGEESTFFVTALRTVGIPARQVYTNRWAHSDDNHAWVEIWIDGKWYFLGACEPEPDLNMGWFAGPSTQTMLVNTRAYGWYNGSEPYIIRSARFAELNLIGNYAKTKTIYVKVVNQEQQPVENSKVEYQLYNYAEFFPLAKTYTDNLGMSSFTTGFGDLMIWANIGNTFGYKKITVAEVDTIVIKISNEIPDNRTEEYDWTPPRKHDIVQSSDAGRQENSRRLLVEDSIRSVYMKTFKDSAWAKNFATELEINADSTISFITRCFGNWKEITDFLRNTPPELRPYALKLLSVISDKDLRDTKAAILTDHLNNSMAYHDTFGSNEYVWANYVLSGRIANEMMVSWKKFLKDNLSIALKSEDLIITQESIKNWVKNNIKIDTIANAHSRAPLTPRGVYTLMVADPLSRDIFYVAACRTFGFAARLNSETSVPQYLTENGWIDVSFDSVQAVNPEKGYVHFKNLSSFDPKYYINFTIELFRDGVYRTLEFDDAKPLSAFHESIVVPSGHYILVTGNRRQDGSVLNSVSFFNVIAGETKEVQVKVRDIKQAKDYWVELKADEFDIKLVNDNNTVKLSSITNAKPFIIVFIEPDKEPSKHVMADLQPVKAELEAWGGNVLFMLEPGKAPESFNPEIFAGLPHQSIFAWDLESKLLNHLSKIKAIALENTLPVIIAGDENGKLYYFVSGYRIGIGEQLMKALK